MRGTSLDHYYYVLGIDPSASPAELTRAHRDLAQVWHPDRFTANPRLQRMAEEKLRQINEAYTVLRGGQAPRWTPADVHRRRTPDLARWLYGGVQAVIAAAAVLALIVSTGAIHRWLTGPAAPEIAAEQSKARPAEDENTRPAVRRGGSSHAEAGQT